MTRRSALVALLATALLVACSAPGSQTSASSPGAATATSSASASGSPATATSGANTSATASAAKATATASATWTLSINGLGPLVLGTLYPTLRQQGYVGPETGDCPGSWTSQALQDKGVYLYPSGTGDTSVLAEVSVTKPTYATVSGAKVGTTMGRLKQLYGAQLTAETKNGNGGPFQVAVVHIGTREIVFEFPFASTLADTDPVTAMVARPWDPDMMGEC